MCIYIYTYIYIYIYIYISVCVCVCALQGLGVCGALGLLSPGVWGSGQTIGFSDFSVRSFGFRA